jgi:hypothetical protein
MENETLPSSKFWQSSASLHRLHRLLARMTNIEESSKFGSIFCCAYDREPAGKGSRKNGFTERITLVSIQRLGGTLKLSILRDFVPYFTI